MTKIYDVGIGWASPIDAVFVSLLKKELRSAKLSVDEITYQNISERFEEIRNGSVAYRWYLDRSSIDYPPYAQIAWMLAERGVRVVNNPTQAARWGSKIALHKAFASAGIPVPKTRIVYSLSEAKREAPRALKEFTVPFVIKPAYGGMENDVLMTASRKEDVTKFMEGNGNDAALMQEFLTPAVIAGRAGWFRPLYVCGAIIPLRWNPVNHFYEELRHVPEENAAATVLEKTLLAIYSITGFDVFSAEIVFTNREDYFVVDYANHPIDLGAQDISADALPRRVLSTVADHLVRDIVKI